MKMGFKKTYVGVSAKKYVDLTNKNGILARCTNKERIWPTETVIKLRLMKMNGHDFMPGKRNVRVTYRQSQLVGPKMRDTPSYGNVKWEKWFLRDGNAIQNFCHVPIRGRSVNRTPLGPTFSPYRLPTLIQWSVYGGFPTSFSGRRIGIVSGRFYTYETT